MQQRWLEKPIFVAARVFLFIKRQLFRKCVVYKQKYSLKYIISNIYFGPNKYKIVILLSVTEQSRQKKTLPE